ncbi:MAG: TolC family protein [bacterium]
MKKKIFLLMLLIFSFSSKVQANEHLINLIKANIEKGDALTLEQCIEFAIDNNPNITSAKNTAKVIESKVSQAKSNYLPQLNLSTGYDRRNSSTDSSYDKSSNQMQANITLNQVIYDFGKIASNVKIQNYNLKSSESDLDNTVIQTVFYVKKAYYGVLSAVKSKEVYTKAVDQYNDLLKQANAFYKEGLKPKIDVTTAEVNLSNAKLNLIKADNAVKTAYANLNNAIGISDALNYNLKDNLVFSKYDIDFQNALDNAYNNRPDLKTIAVKESSASESVKLSKKNYLPELNGFSNYGFGGKGFPLDNGWSVGANITLPVFNGFLTKNKIKEAEANLNVVKSNEEILKQNALLDVQQAYISFIEAEKSIPVAELITKQAKENFDIAIGRYKVGVGNHIEVKDAELTYRNAELTKIQALYDYNIAVSNLERAMGIK